MRKLHVIFFSLFLLFGMTHVNAQFDNEIREQVLKKAIVDSLFVFGKWNNKDGIETQLKYLGEVKAKHDQTYRILNYSYIWGQAHHASSKILIYNGNNRFLGFYALGSVYDLPDGIENGNLVFTHKGDKDCSGKKTSIDLRKGLPKQFFVECQGGKGDVFGFFTEE